MKIDLCKIFGVEEGEEFRLAKTKPKTRYRFYNNSLQVFDTDLKEWRNSSIIFNYVIDSDIIKLPKKKQFTDDELAIMRSLPKGYKWIARDESGRMFMYNVKPKKSDSYWKAQNTLWNSLVMFEHIFQSIQWEDEEPVFIDDYVERNN